jgi:hypothetical protein
LTDSYGQARIRLAPQTKAGDVVMLQIVDAPRDLVMVSPWDKWVHVPPFDNEAKNFVPVVLTERGDKACLENVECIRAAASQILRVNAPKQDKTDSEEDRKQALADVAKAFGLKPEEVDQAIRAWGAKTEDPYEKGLAALYEKRYREATGYLTISLEKRKQAESEAREQVADAALFLGASLYEPGKVPRVGGGLWRGSASASGRRDGPE